jgi:hypothetical protein
MKRGNPEPLSSELQAELDALAAMPDSEIDTTDMPHITDWSNAVRGPSRPDFRFTAHSPRRPHSRENPENSS